MSRFIKKEFRALHFNAFIGMFLLLISISVQSQTRPPQNIRRITVTCKYELVNGKNTGRYWPVYQEVYDSLGRLHTEIDWDFPDNQPHKYIWHTFVGKQRVKVENFENEKLQLIREFGFNKDSLLSKEIIKKVNPGDTSIFLTLFYSYDHQKHFSFIDARTGENKKAYTVKSTYDLRGNELTRTVKTKKGFVPIDSIVFMNCNLRYDSIGRVIRKEVFIKKSNLQESKSDYTYTYDLMGNLASIVTSNSSGKMISREERIYDPIKNRLQQIKYYNSQNQIIKWLSKRYEIYRSNDRRFREIEY